MRNTNKYTKLYSGGTPTFIEDNVFEIIIPTENVADLQVGPDVSRQNNSNTGQEKQNFAQKNERSLSEVLSEVLLAKDYKKVESIILFLEKNDVVTPSQAKQITGKSSATVRRYLKILVDTGYIETTGSTNNVEYIVAK